MEEKIIKVLKSKELVMMSCDTVYGIVGLATSSKAIKKVYAAKKRDLNKALIILVSDLKMLKKYARITYRLEEELIAKYWPGPLTMLLAKKRRVNPLLNHKGKYIGIRIPNDLRLLRIIKDLGKPIVATSANMANKPVIRKVKDLDKEVQEKIALILDEGEKEQQASTIVQVTNNKINIIREGDLARDIKQAFSNNIFK